LLDPVTNEDLEVINEGELVWRFSTYQEYQSCLHWSDTMHIFLRIVFDNE